MLCLVAQRKKPKRKVISRVKKKKLAEALILNNLKLKLGRKRRLYR